MHDVAEAIKYLADALRNEKPKYTNCQQCLGHAVSSHESPMAPVSKKIGDIEITGWKCTLGSCGFEVFPGVG